MISALTKIVGCTLVGQRATLTHLMLSPEVPIAGQNQTLTIGYSLAGSSVTGGTASQATTVNYVPLQTLQQDLCTQTKCPIVAGDHSEVSSFQVPSNFKGIVNSQITWTDQDNVPLWCVKFNLNVDSPTDSEGSSSGSGSGSSSSSGSGSGSSSSSGSSSGSGSGSSSSSGSSTSSGSGSGSSTSSGSGSSSSGSGTSSGSSSGSQIKAVTQQLRKQKH